MILVDATDLRASWPGKPLFDALSVTVSSGDRLGVVGINGSGKSTLLRFLAGTDTPEAGALRWGRDARIAMLDQQAVVPAGLVGAVVGDSWEAAAVLERLGMGACTDRPTDELSGGQAKRVALARALLGVEDREHDLLLLDEPTNHLDIDAIDWLQERLRRFRGGLVLVTHDRHLLDAVTTKVLEIDRGAAYIHVPTSASGGSGYQAYLEGRARREEQAAESERARRGLARRELAWLRRGAPARTSKPKARLDAAQAIVAGPATIAARSGALAFGDLGSQRLGSKAVELHAVGHRWEDASPWLFRGLELSIDPGDRLGVAGLNGAGKSTLLDVIAGRLEPAEGTVERGATVQIGYYDQTGATLDLSMRVRDAVAGPHRQPDHTDAALLRRFWFDDDAQFAPIRLLSGGERRRLQLLMVLAAQPNVLLLDEPTNDLDLDTLRSLEDLLESWPGSVVVVSHDRAFLERTVEHIVAVDGDRSGLVPGGYDGWLARRGTSPAPAPAGARQALATSPAPPPRTGRTPSTLGRLLRDAERAMEKATNRRDSLIEEMAGLTDHVAIAEVGHRLAEADADLAAAEERWLEVASEAESG